MTAIAIKKKAHQYLDNTDEKILRVVYTILEDHVKSKSARISIEQYNKELEDAEKRIAKGKYKTQEQVERLLDKI